MTANPIRRGRAWSKAAHLGLAVGLLVALAACTPRQKPICVDSGGVSSSPSLFFCEDQYDVYGREYRGR